MKVQISDRKTLIKLLQNKLAKNGYETNTIIVGTRIQDLEDMSDRSIARRLFGLIHESDYSDGVLFLDLNIAEDLLGEPLNQYMKRQEEINQLRLNTSPMSTWKSSKEAE